MKMIRIIVFLLMASPVFAQVENKIPQYTFNGRLGVGRLGNNDTTAYLHVGSTQSTKGMLLPRVLDTALVAGNKGHGLLIWSVQKNKMAYWDSVNAVWSDIGGGGSTYTEGYGIDITGLTISTDTSVITSRLWHKKGIDSVAAIARVTEVAAGYGIDISGGSITTAGFVNVDTFHMATRLRVQKQIDSLDATGVTMDNHPSGTGIKILNYYSDPDYGYFKTLAPGTGITFDTSAHTITINSTGGGGGDELYVVHYTNTGIWSGGVLNDTTLYLKNHVAGGYGLNITTQIDSSELFFVDSTKLVSWPQLTKRIDSLGIAIGVTGWNGSLQYNNGGAHGAENIRLFWYKSQGATSDTSALFSIRQSTQYLYGPGARFNAVDSNSAGNRYNGIYIANLGTGDAMISFGAGGSWATSTYQASLGIDQSDAGKIKIGPVASVGQSTGNDAIVINQSGVVSINTATAISGYGITNLRNISGASSSTTTTGNIMVITNTNVPLNGFGVHHTLRMPNGSGTARDAMQWGGLWEDVTNASEDAAFYVNLFRAGSSTEAFRVTSLGKFVRPEVTNGGVGLATLVGGTVTVNNTSVTANSRITLTVATPGGTQGFLSYSLSAGTSFTINSTSGTETSTVSWTITN